MHLCDRVCFLYSRIEVTKPNLVLTVDSMPNADIISVGYATQKFIKYEGILEIFIAKQYVVVLALVSQHDH